MKLTVKTLQLQELVSKAIKGASNNKMIPITWLIAIELKSNTLTLTTTDATNNLKVLAKDIQGEDFYVVVQADIFSKLVAKMTSDNISLTVKDTSLEVVGNGKYNLEIPLDEEGNGIVIRDKNIEWDMEQTTTNLKTIKTMLTVNKVSLAKTMEVPCLTAYYVGENILTTNGFKACASDLKVFAQPVLLPAELVDLLAVIDKDNIIVRQSDKYIEFCTENVIVRGAKLNDELKNFPVAGMQGYLSANFPNSCKISKSQLLAVLDRLLLFITPYDKNGLYLTFTEKGLQISSKQSTGIEEILYTAPATITPFTCCINIELWQPQVSAIAEENIEIYFGHSKAIKMVSGEVTQITALLEDDRVTDNGPTA
ncbi:hypothetical protein [Bacteroides sp.]|uniref:hypothetical protein n=1 Tax=Bacteroides sp. TaxID=29523 RepID=UPI002617ACC7|nr:hypothetical protein [Bacteroides sp.]MDD3039718.1 hypothetical protein [Bacteroides sp.]